MRQVVDLLLLVFLERRSVLLRLGIHIIKSRLIILIMFLEIDNYQRNVVAAVVVHAAFLYYLFADVDEGVVLVA